MVHGLGGTTDAVERSSEWSCLVKDTRERFGMVYTTVPRGIGVCPGGETGEGWGDGREMQR